MLRARPVATPSPFSAAPQPWPTPPTARRMHGSNLYDPLGVPVAATLESEGREGGMDRLRGHGRQSVQNITHPAGAGMVDAPPRDRAFRTDMERRATSPAALEEK